MVEKIHAISLGCPKNRTDTERVLSTLLTTFPNASLTGSPKDAGLIVVNTCAFIQEAVEESIETILTLAQERRDQQILVVMGCLPRRYGMALEKELPEVDCFFGHQLDSNTLERIRSAIKKRTGLEPECEPLSPTTDAHHRLVTTPPWRAFVKIVEGCSNNCSFCLIPRIRGGCRPRPLKDIISELHQLEAAGVREVTFVGQDLTAWRDGDMDLAGFIDNVSRETSIDWLRFLYLHPKGITERLLERMATTKNCCKYLDIPTQHASSRILKKMGRRYEKGLISDLFQYIRSNLPDFTIRTTVMVGFPGETEEDFRELMDFIEEHEVDWLGCFAYSDEEEALSAKLPFKVPKKLAQERMAMVLEKQRAITQRRLSRYRGRKLPVLLEGRSEETDLLLVGRTEFQAPEVDGVCYINQGMGTPGAFFSVEITDSFHYDLIGGIKGPLAGPGERSAQNSGHM